MNAKTPTTRLLQGRWQPRTIGVLFLMVVLRVHGAVTLTELGACTEGFEAVVAVAISPDLKYLATGSNNGEDPNTRVCDTTTGRLVREIETGLVHHPWFTPDSARLLCNRDLFDLAPGDVVRTFDSGAGPFCIYDTHDGRSPVMPFLRMPIASPQVPSMAMKAPFRCGTCLAGRSCTSITDTARNGT